MLAKFFRVLFLLPLLALFTGAWTFEIIEKPGSDHIIQGQKMRDSGDYEGAISSFNKANQEAIDYNTKSKALTQKAAVYLMDPNISPGKASEARNLLQEAESLGYARASLFLGEMYQEGIGIQPDYKVAYNYFSKVKDRYSSALISLAEITADTISARNYIAAAADKIDRDVNPSSKSMLRLARHFRDGNVVAANYALAEYWYSRAVRAGSVSAVMEFANFWKKHRHLPKSDIVNLWKKASSLGNDKADLELGFSYLIGSGVMQDVEKSEMYFARAVSANPENAYRIARWYEEQSKLDPRYMFATNKWYDVAFEKGNSNAILRKARMFWGGKEGLPVDKAKARQLYNIAAQKGNDKALSELAEREQRDIMRAKKLAAKKALKKKKKAQKRAQSYSKKGGDFKYWLPLAERGNSEGMLNVGNAYMQGNGVEVDKEKGVDWLLKASSAGNGDAMYSLAQIYSAGLGVESDIGKAYEWYEKAANAGNAAGQYHLGLGYARGIGVSKDSEKARLWLGKASKNGYSRADNILSTIVQ